MDCYGEGAEKCLFIFSKRSGSTSLWKVKAQVRKGPLGISTWPHFPTRVRVRFLQKIIDQKTREGCGCPKFLAGKVFGQISTLLENSLPIFRQHEMLSLPRFGHFPARKTAAGKLAAPSGMLLDFLLRDRHSLLEFFWIETMGSWGGGARGPFTAKKASFRWKRPNTRSSRWACSQSLTLKTGVP